MNVQDITSTYGPEETEQERQERERRLDQLNTKVAEIATKLEEADPIKPLIEALHKRVANLDYEIQQLENEISKYAGKRYNQALQLALKELRYEQETEISEVRRHRSGCTIAAGVEREGGNDRPLPSVGAD